mmetsp:Transcript_14576/g.63141  ORF Transcript_14576/g.63141 Transcript_14576/m.63141 type:complete len:630 (+) Transcript_14576:1418-3307(+)
MDSRAVTRPARVRDHVADVVHAGAEEDETLKPESKPGVHHGSVPPQVHVPLVLLGFQAHLDHPALHYLQTLLSLRSADELANLGHQHVHRGHRLAVLVEPHVKRLDVLGVVVHDDRLLEDLLGQVALVLRREVDAPLHRVHKLFASRHSLLEELDGLGVGHAAKGGRRHVLHAVQSLLIVHLGDEREVLGAVLEDVVEAVLHVVLGALHVILEVGEGYLGLNHPKFSEVARRVGVLGSERRPERVDVPHGARVNLGVELAGHGQVGGFAEEVLAVVHGAGGVAGDVAARRRRGRILEGLRLRLEREELGDGFVHLLLRRLALLLGILEGLDDDALLRGGGLGGGDVSLGRDVRLGGGDARRVDSVDERGDLELLAGALAVGRGDDRGVDVLEAVLLEEGVRGVRELVPDAGDRADGVGPRPEVRDAAEVLEGVPLLLQGEGGRVGSSDELDGLDGHLHRLLTARRFHHGTLDEHRGAGGDVARVEVLAPGDVSVHHRLDAAQRRAVVHLDEREVLLRADGADPAAELHGIADAGLALVLALDGGDALVALERRRRGGRRGGIRGGGDGARANRDHRAPGAADPEPHLRRGARARERRPLRGGASQHGAERRGGAPEALRAVAHHHAGGH